MSWKRKVSGHLDEVRQAVRLGREHQRCYQENKERIKAEQKAARKAGRFPENMGPPPSGFSLLPWLMMGMGAFSNIFQGRTPNPLIGGLASVLNEDLQNHCGELHTAGFPFEKSCRHEDGTVEGANSLLFDGIFFGSMAATAACLTAAFTIEASRRT